ncbi:hypothetical protein cypCar_00044109, partial [Cyprinus carpio]
MASNSTKPSGLPGKMKKDESLLGKLGGTLVRKKKLKEEENAERTILDPTSREDLNFKDLQKVLIDWINSELEEDRIIVKDLEEDLYDGQVLQKLFAIHSKNLVSIVCLLLALAIYYAAPIRLPEHVSIKVIVVKKKEGILQTAHVTKQLTSTTTEMMIGRS